MRPSSATALCRILRDYALQRPERVPEQWPLTRGRIRDFHQWPDSRPCKGAFLVQPTRGDPLWIVASDWQAKDNYYVVVFPASRAGPIAEIHETVGGPDGETLNWTYRPSLRDGRNAQRRAYFQEAFGSLAVAIYLPTELDQIDDFIDSLATLAMNRREADSLPASRPSGRSEFPEGKLVERLHKQRERSAYVIQEAKKRVLARGERLTCACCGFDFEKTYGPLGRGFIEGHHVKPVSGLAPDGEVTRVEDIALVCSNCHRMLHRRRPWLSPNDLPKLLSDV